MSHNQYLSRSTKRRRFLEEVEVIDLFKENSYLVSPEPQPSSHQLEECLDTSTHITQLSGTNYSDSHVNNLEEIESFESKSDSYYSSDEKTADTERNNNPAAVEQSTATHYPASSVRLVP
ncbi:hypothetical protein ACI65C_003833 [Semiaphis heraclei]